MTEPERRYIEKLRPYQVMCECIPSKDVLDRVREVMERSGSAQVKLVKIVQESNVETILHVVHDWKHCHRAPVDCECECCHRLIETGDLCRIFTAELEEFGRGRVYVCTMCSD
jgi:hypothetical protein